MAEEVIIAGWMDYEPRHRDEVVRHLPTVAMPTADEPGCLDYAMTPDAENPRRIRVFERWASQADLDAHLDRPHVLAFRQAIAAVPRVDRSLARYVVESGGSFR
jgi:quinol monooxygenase YgiN